MDQIVGHGSFASLGRGQLSTGRKRHLLERGEVVFGLGEAQPEGNICISGADHMRHAKGVTLDANIILPGLSDQRGRIRRRRLVQPVSHDQEYEGPDNEYGKCQDGDLECAHESW